MLLAGTVDYFSSPFVHLSLRNTSNSKKSSKVQLLHDCCSRALPSSAAVFANANATLTATGGMWVAVCSYAAIQGL